MPKFTCERCLKEFNHKGHYNEHMNRKYPCEVNPKVKKKKCEHCGKFFTRPDSLSRHRKSCKVKATNSEKSIILSEILRRTVNIVKSNPEKFNILHDKVKKKKEKKYPAEDVYIMQDREHCYKIGHTIDVTRRRKDFQTGNSSIMTIIDNFRCAKPTKLEKDTHKKYKEYNIHGEWYEFNDNMLKEVQAYMEDRCMELNKMYRETHK